ncbi:uncharacterized protein LOC113511344 isoform X2 [Galleria mellonella]|uniref:Uncharacterized protein LOC113511344 isoform X2 n=1 Tax=Galleria mellonella TaxID=7137 RepID=A0ABM3N2M1_GALME|nr:uncharacterized protein LOC113511344 isoform X2 [Galleria mellonella]
MLKGWIARCSHVGLLWSLFWVCNVDGLIEIVEEQRCHDYRFRLTCRDLDTHIAILEAWYTTLEDYYDTNTTHASLKLKTENDSELNRVYIYSSPKHNGIYEPANHSIFENISNSSLDYNESSSVNDSLTNDLDVTVDYVNNSECGAVTFARSYGSSREGDKRRVVVERSSSRNLRAPLSYRCTGINHCSFVLAQDYAPAVSWPPGVVYIKYACFDDTLSIHYCNREVQVAVSGADSEGYMRTPGYPHFYVGEECHWRIRVNPEQRIRLTLLDVSLRTIGPFEESCTDFIAVEDSNGESMFTSCDQVELPLKLLSTTDTVDVTVQVKSEGAYPKRGVLLHYKSIGCVTLPEPSEGYLVYRNSDVAHYMCNVNYVFSDTRQRARLLWCYDDNRWNDTVPLCVEAALTAVGNNSDSGGDEKDTKLPPHDEPNMMVDIVIPSLLIAALFIGNAFIVLIIYKYRKRKNEEIDDEFNTIPLSVNGNVHSAGNAV